jgi:hypothetical protein
MEFSGNRMTPPLARQLFVHTGRLTAKHLTSLLEHERQQRREKSACGMKNVGLVGSTFMITIQRVTTCEENLAERLVSKSIEPRDACNNVGE